MLDVATHLTKYDIHKANDSIKLNKKLLLLHKNHWINPLMNPRGALICEVSLLVPDESNLILF